MQSRKRKWLIALASFVLLVATTAYFNRTTLAMWGFDLLWADKIEQSLEESHKPLEGRKPKPVKEEAEAREPFSLLLMGVDQRDKEHGRSDTMIYTVVRPKDGSMLMISIPRDSDVEIVGKNRKDKINHAYAFGGAKMALETVEELFGSSVDYYASINFEGFRHVIDAMGGIALPIEEDLVNKDPNHEKFVVKAGQDLYNGQDALNYVRYREDAGGDMSRTVRHQTFIQSMLDKATGVGQWGRVPELIEIMGDNFATDLTPQEIVSLGKSMLQAGHRTIYSHTLQGEGAIGRGGAWLFDLDEADLEKAKGWISSWLDGSIPKNELPLPDQYVRQGGTASPAA
ncbi:LCP family protein [Paenibacillus daejeonensis]|uniref:LCP family protein n=1 Tax=Paenibacillus daejeonensis TaxID=135193 RepID=UPI00036D55C7|nr:LCP family protein [Paenibacillus daejeonensis]